MDKTEALEIVMWAKRESAKLAQDWAPGWTDEKDLVRYWRQNRPRMVERLEAHGAVEALAHVLIHRHLAAEREYLRAGMPMPDAREQAEREWLLREPEDEDDEPLPDQITTSPTQND